ncbi:hypothetical protein Tsubulata_046661 [Turnera subulata]|uniref:PPC domain-containing protein n=1 Tax=Turnera subulata TaxID=218843 RepID=A0A9Q0JQ84_9ROSI|nr:hypothetical protein Tsubulata_046661 [Turnera subulata]
MSNPQSDPLMQLETTCGSLLYELQIIWDEVGESDTERDKMLLELEQECLEVYRRKVDQANKNRAQLRQSIADCEAELAAICSAMGERPVHIRQADQNAASLKDELRTILPQLEEMRNRKSDRRKQFVEVLEDIQKISTEIYGSPSHIPVDETDLSLRKLEELHRQLHTLEKERTDRLKQVQEHLDTLTSLCSVLGMDFNHTVSQVHPSYGSTDLPRNINDPTIQSLETAIHNLRELQDLATTMLELWNLMDTPIEEQQEFQNVTCNIAASEHEITEPNTLSVDFINYVEAEVSRLEELKASKMKELVLKKRSELEEICRKTHMVPEADTGIEDAIEAIESGNMDPSDLLEQIELQIGNVKEEAFNRKEILEKVEKWLGACEEECWLEEYNRDENRYNAGRGTHLALKRAEKARALVSKLPGMVEALAAKTMAWEKERGIEFFYDGVSPDLSYESKSLTVRLLSMLEEYTILRQEKEEERRRQREVLYGSKPSPSKPQSLKKAPRASTGGASNKRLSLAGPMTPKATATPHARLGKKTEFSNYEDGLSAVRRGLDIAGLPAKKHSFGAVHAREPEPTLRKPFSPISTTASSKSNIEDNKMHSEKVKKTLPTTDISFSTPSKATTVAADEENRTPKTMPIPVPSTPSTVSVAMQTAMTPVPMPFVANPAEQTPEDIEYSFEERRAGFVLPKAKIKSMIQVKEEVSAGVAVKGDEAPGSFIVTPRAENSIPNSNPNHNNSISTPNPNHGNSIPIPSPGNSIPTPNPNPNPSPAQFGGPAVAASPVSGGTGTGVKKKRGRPRKYAPDGTLATALSPMPISSSIPLGGEYPSWKRGRGKPVESIKKQHNSYEYETPGEKIAYFVGANFTPHVITVNAGEDVTMKVMSFSQQGARAICILSANGTISNVTLRQPTSSGGTLTYEGRFEILSLSGSYMPTENGGTKSRSGGMSVSLAGPDGRVVGGGLAGLLIAAGPVQVVVGSFLPGHQQEHKKQRTEPAPAVVPATVNIFSPEEMKGGYGGVKPVLISPSSMYVDNSVTVTHMQAFTNPASDNRTSSAEDDSRDHDQSNCEVSC